MTLLPYWLRFRDPRSCPTTGFDPGKAFVPRAGNFAPRVCPDCLLYDIRNHGAAYWHRVHQLPNVFVCPRHRVMLFARCSVCGATPRALSCFIAPPLSRICQCGADLALQRKPVQADRWWWYWNLVSLSIEALSSSTKPTGVSNSLAYKRYARNSDGDLSFQAVLHEAQTLWKNNIQPLVFYLGRCPSTREFCLYFAMRGMNLAQAMASVHSATSQLAPDTPPPTSNLSDFRRQFQAAMSAEPARIPSQAPGYWALRLLDPDWLEANYPIIGKGKRRGPVPSVVADRIKMLNIYRTRKRRKGAAFERARIRDRNWQEGQARKYRAEDRAERQAVVQIARSFSLLRTMQNLEHSAPAERVTHSLLASHCTLSMYQVRRVFRSDPVLKAEFERINRERPFRVLKQTALRMVRSGIPLATVDWARQAKVPTSPKFLAAMRQIRVELAKNVDHGRRAPRGSRHTGAGGGCNGVVISCPCQQRLRFPVARC